MYEGSSGATNFLLYILTTPSALLWFATCAVIGVKANKAQNNKELIPYLLTIAFVTYVFYKVG